MLITKMEQVKKELFRIDLDYEFTFALYEREVRRFHLEEGIEISLELAELIEKEIVLPRARRKVMSFLKHGDRTREELKKKLLFAFFSTDMAEQALNYVEKFGYIDDNRYMENYVFFKKNGKSRKQIELELLQKGIERDSISQYLEENLWDEEEILKNLVQKRLRGKKLQEEKELQKQYAYFVRKGYRFSMVKKVVQEYLEQQEEENL